MRGSRLRACGLMLLMMSGTSLMVHAADGEDAKRSLARVQALLKQVNAQKTAAEAELAKVQQQLAERDMALADAKSAVESGRRELKDSAGQLAAAKERGESLSGDLGKMKERLAKTEERLKETSARLRDTTQTLRQTESAKREVEAALADARKALEDSDGKNHALHTVNRELIDHFSKEGFFGRLLRTEPVTGLAGVRAENYLQDASIRNDDNQRPMTKAQPERKP